MIEDMVGGGIYIAKKIWGSRCEPSLETVPGVDQEVNVMYDLEGITVNTDIRDIAIPVFNGMYPSFDFTQRIKSTEDLISYLQNSAMLDYVRFAFGSVSRPFSLIVDPDSIQGKLGDDVTLTSKSMPSLRFRDFKLSYITRGIVQYGGCIDNNTSDEKVRTLTAWANETLPINNT